MIGIQPQDVPRLWGHVRHLVNKALKYANGEYQETDVFDALLSAKMQLWWSGDTILITEIAVYPRKKACIGLLASGSLEELKKALPSIELWAKAQGCDAAYIYGRRGWKRALADKGYVERHCNLRKEL